METGNLLKMVAEMESLNEEAQALQTEMEARAEALQEALAPEMAAVEEEYQKALKAVQEKHEPEAEALQKEFQPRMDAMKQKMDGVKKALMEAIDASNGVVVMGEKILRKARCGCCVRVQEALSSQTDMTDEEAMTVLQGNEDGKRVMVLPNRVLRLKADGESLQTYPLPKAQ